jgi:hypothetical protein
VSKSTFTLPGKQRRRAFGAGTPVIEIAHRRHNVRIAKVTFYAVTIVVGVLAGTVASTLTSTVRAVFIGIIGGLATGVIVSAIVLVWPVLRILWHWIAEIATGSGLLAAYLALVDVMLPWQAGLTLATAIGGPLALPFTRTRLMPIVWCAITRHRLRLCFAQFVKTNHHGTVPFILLARPTPAGERIWVWLRPGLALTDIEPRRDKLAVACWAHDIRLTPASKRYAAFVRVDITRRNPLTAVINNPLPTLITNTDTTDPARTAPDTTTVPAGLDLPDIPDDPVINPDRPAHPADVKPGPDKRTGKPLRAVPPTEPTAAGDEITDWI